jgi:hypothetical protein
MSRERTTSEVVHDQEEMPEEGADSKIRSVVHKPF